MVEVAVEPGPQRHAEGNGEGDLEAGTGMAMTEAFDVVVVGAGLGESTPAMSRALSAIGDVRLHMLSLSATGINLTLIVDGEQVRPVMQRLHETFFGTGE